jgi:hypothetical protein
LEFISRARNSIVHRGEMADYALLTAQWASLYAGELIGFCVFNKYDLRKHRDIIDYLNTPSSRDRLERAIALHKFRLKILKAEK